MLFDQKRVLFSTVFATVMCATAVVSAPSSAEAEACICSVAPWSASPVMEAQLPAETILWCEDGDDPRCSSDDGNSPSSETRSTFSAHLAAFEIHDAQLASTHNGHSPYDKTLGDAALSRVDRPPQASL